MARQNVRTQHNHFHFNSVQFTTPAHKKRMQLTAAADKMPTKNPEVENTFYAVGCEAVSLD